jgi:hypothetical protein
MLRLRVRERRLQREQEARIHLLGEATYRNDKAAVEALRAQAHDLGEQIQQIEQELRDALVGAKERVGQERLATQSTQVLPAGDTHDSDHRHDQS